MQLDKDRSELGGVLGMFVAECRDRMLLLSHLGLRGGELRCEVGGGCGCAVLVRREGRRAGGRSALPPQLVQLDKGRSELGGVLGLGAATAGPAPRRFARVGSS